jgi:F0F1-type ATP synthase assembly protein I
MFGFYGSYWNELGGWMGEMMNCFHDFMVIYGNSYEFFSILTIIGLVCGILIIVSAAMLVAQPQGARNVGALSSLFFLQSAS